MVQKGDFSSTDELREDAIEKATFIYPASKYGQAAEQAANSDVNHTWDWLSNQAQGSNWNRLVNNLPPLEHSIASESEVELPSDDESDSNSQVDVFDRNIDPNLEISSSTLDSVATAVDLTDNSIRTKSVKPNDDNKSIMTSIITRTSATSLNRPTYVPNQETATGFGPSTSKPVDALITRPKKAFLGRAFLSFGNFIKPLHGTKIFPLSPKQEKLYFKVATDSPIDHYDGETDQTFMDDIKKFMKPILESFLPNDQLHPRFLFRRRNKFLANWRAKFPLASNRIMEYSGLMGEDDSFYSITDFEQNQNIYDGFQTLVS